MVNLTNGPDGPLFELDTALGSVRLAMNRIRERAASAKQPQLPLTSPNGETPVEPASGPRRKPRVPPKATKALSAAVATLPEEFTTKELWTVVGTLHPHTGRVGVLGALKEAVEAGRLQQVAPGVGRRPARYRKATMT